MCVRCVCVCVQSVCGVCAIDLRDGLCELPRGQSDHGAVGLDPGQVLEEVSPVPALQQPTQMYRVQKSGIQSLVRGQESRPRVV